MLLKVVISSYQARLDAMPTRESELVDQSWPVGAALRRGGET